MWSSCFLFVQKFHIKEENNQMWWSTVLNQICTGFTEKILHPDIKCYCYIKSHKPCQKILAVSPTSEMKRRICLSYGTQRGALTLTVFWHLARSTHQHCEHLLRIYIPDIVNSDGTEHTVTKLLTQRDTSSENKAGQTVGSDSWLTVGKKREGGGQQHRWCAPRRGHNGCSV